VINLMDAIRASMKQVKTPAAAKKPAKEAAGKRTSPLRQVVATARKTKPKKKSG
jgi:hypothetical protein